jgi:hypothetical protein
MNELTEQFIIYDTSGSKLFEIHFDGNIAGGYDYIRRRILGEADVINVISNIELAANN